MPALPMAIDEPSNAADMLAEKPLWLMPWKAALNGTMGLPSDRNRHMDFASALLAWLQHLGQAPQG